MNKLNTRLLGGSLAAGLLVLVLGAGSGLADSHRDHEAARMALEAGQILSLRKILDLVEQGHPGQIMEIELETKKDGWVYEVKLLRPDGALVKIKLDARDGQLLKMKEKTDD
jgi:uncharacterized membrane protein YkoI